MSVIVPKLIAGRPGMKAKRNAAILACLLANSCAVSHGARIAWSENTNRSVKQLQQDRRDGQTEEPLDPTLLSLLQQEQGILKPFAWGTWDEDGAKGKMIGIDQQGRLKNTDFAKTTDGYTVNKSELQHEMNEPLKSSGRLNLEDYVTDREFPFRTDIITIGDCHAHFVLVWNALNRSLRKTSLLDRLGVRIIVERDSQVISNEVDGIAYFGLHEAFVRDINGDGRQDFVVMGNDNYVNIHIWTLEPECIVKKIPFKEDDEVTSSVPGREVVLKPNKPGRGYAIHTRLSVPTVENGKDYWQVTERVYKWEDQESAYRMVKKFNWLKSAE